MLSEVMQEVASVEVTPLAEQRGSGHLAVPGSFRTQSRRKAVASKQERTRE